MKNITNYKYLLAIIPLLIICLLWIPAEAKKTKKNKIEQVQAKQSGVSYRLNNLSVDDKRRFEALSKEQQDTIRNGKIGEGFNAWMVELALGKPFYATEHHPIFKDYEEVWLYVKPDINKDVREENIIDPQTNWPTIHRTETIKTCYISDYFILWDRGVVQLMHPADAPQVHGSCTIETKEAFLPIVDGKAVEKQ